MNPNIGARLGFGCAAIPGRLTKRDALTLLETAYACGIRHFDTARMYSSGASEGIVGELVRQCGSEIVVVTKAGLEPSTRLSRGLGKLAAVLPSLSKPRTARFGPSRIRRSVEKSLRELKLERLDALLLHEVGLHHISDELQALLADLRREGKIAHLGIATSIEASEAILAANPELCEIVQVPVGWLDQPRKLPAGTRLIVHSVLGPRLAGFITMLRSSSHMARRFKEETGLAASDTSEIGRLMLQDAMARNPHGVTLFSTTQLERIRLDADLLTSNHSAHPAAALRRAMATTDSRAAS